MVTNSIGWGIWRSPHSGEPIQRSPHSGAHTVEPTLSRRLEIKELACYLCTLLSTCINEITYVISLRVLSEAPYQAIIAVRTGKSSGLCYILWTHNTVEWSTSKPLEFWYFCPHQKGSQSRYHWDFSAVTLWDIWKHKYPYGTCGQLTGCCTYIAINYQLGRYVTAASDMLLGHAHPYTTKLESSYMARTAVQEDRNAERTRGIIALLDNTSWLLCAPGTTDWGSTYRWTHLHTRSAQSRNLCNLKIALHSLRIWKLLANLEIAHKGLHNLEIVQFLLRTQVVIRVSIVYKGKEHT